MKKQWWGVLLTMVILITGCTPAIPIGLENPGNLLLVEQNLTVEITFTNTITSTVTPSITPFLPSTATVTPIPPTATITPDPKLSQFGPGDVLIPILMYHHVSPNANSEYAVSIDQFRRQMQWLQDEGYQTVSIADMVTAIQVGKLLPHKPIILTFDDGFMDVYENAYPLLTELGYTATMYLIEDVINEHPYVTDDVMEELINAGWELGHHSKSHAYLPGLRNLDEEVCDSRMRLIERFNQPFDSFAYPFAAKDDKSIQVVKDCGYTSGAGNGSFTIHTEERLFFFSRREIKSYFDMQRFITTVTDVR
jgi:peptidoglycan/xylan/chitin deacetylase (PgdA/CDA1 family)